MINNTSHRSPRRRGAMRVAATLLTATATVFAYSGIAVADNLQDSIESSNPVTLVAGASTGAVGSIKVVGNNGQGDPDDGCNIDPGESPLVLNILTPAGVTASPNPLSIPGCGQFFSITFTASSTAVSGLATATVRSAPAGGGTYNNDVSIPITVTQPAPPVAPTNTTPQVSVTDVSQGAEYTVGAVPTPGCTVTDTEDGLTRSTSAATLTVTPTPADALGSHTAGCSYTDAGQLTGSASVTYSVVPPPNTAPVVQVEGVSNATYEIGNVPTATCSVVDAEDSGESATPDVTGTLTNGLGEQTVRCSYTDAGELTGSASATYTVVDTGDPTIEGEAAPPLAAGQVWYNATTGVPTVTFTCADTGGSGIASCLADGESTGSKTLGEGADQSVSGTASDNAVPNPNTATASVQGLNVDVTAPTVASNPSLAGPKTSPLNDWYTGDVTATFTGSDAGSSGLNGTSARDVVSSGNGPAVEIISPAFSDNAGNVTAAGAQKVTVMIDGLAPNAPVANVNPMPNDAGWNNSGVTVSFAPAGDNGASGVAQCAANVNVTMQTASQVVSGTCTDVAGNVSLPTTVTVMLDTQGPVVTIGTPTDTLGANDWYRSPVTVPFTGSDSLSGPASDVQSVTSSGQGAAVAVSSPAFTDVAGNTTPEGDQSRSFKIDLTNPTAAFDSMIGSVYFGSVPSAPTCTSADALSGPALCTVSGYSTAVGTHTLTATASDIAGRTGTAAQTYTVLAWTLKGFYSPVDMGEVWNSVKGGSTVPLKFEVFAGSEELTSVSAVQSFTQRKVACPSSTAAIDEIEIVTTGGTSLRYDSTGGQFIQNWATPKSPGACYVVTMTTRDGSAITAKFLLK